MGVADNKSYKNQYHFTDDFLRTADTHPSIQDEPKINSTIKKNPYRSNVEIEGGEIVLQPDLSALFQAKGKRHSGGGMDVLLKPESFVFSDFKDLAVTEKEKELFELKMGGKKGDQANTPAEVLKKNVDIKHYNRLVSILDDPNKDDLAKKTATRMLEKYLATVGNIAFIQEQKKGLPDGIPTFAMGTAPVYNQELKDEIMENKQYMKAGGRANPYMQRGGRSGVGRGASTQFSRFELLDKMTPEQRMQAGVEVEWAQLQNNVMRENTRKYGDSMSGRGLAYPGQTPTSAITPPPQNPQTARTSNVPSGGSWGLWQGDKLPVFQDRYGKTNAADKIDNLDALAKQVGYTGPKSNVAFQKWLYNSSPENKAIIDKWHKTYGQGPNAGMFDNKIGIRWTNAIKEITGRPPRIDVDVPSTFSEPPPEQPGAPAVPPAKTVSGPGVPELDITPQGSKQADWRFTPWQQLSQLQSLGQFANVKRYMPYRSRYNATYVDPALVNPEQAIGDVQAQGAQQLSSLTTLNPILRNAQAASISGQIMGNLPGIRSQYDNQNAQILNQTRQYNNQVKNNESLVNMANDQTYYTQAVEGRKNFDNMRSFTGNNAMNNLFRDVETNQKLAYNMLTQNNPAYGFDWRTGNFTRNKKDILDAQSNGVNDRYADLVTLVNSISDPLEKAKLMVKLEGLKTFGSAQQAPQVYKKGGKMKKNPYK